MKDNESVISRRQMLFLGAAGLTFAGGLSRVLSQGMELPDTPKVTMGPFYPSVKPLDQDADMTIVSGRSGKAEGKTINVVGRVLNHNGSPVSGAKIEIWQANSHGRYDHPSDTSDQPLDPNFQGYALISTDTEGRYRFKTIKPAAYRVGPTMQRTPHIHYVISGKADRLETQMFFPGEPLNAEDRIFQELGADKEKAVCKLQPTTKEFDTGSLVFVYDIVLHRG
jgi:protocatechuate 3,4-dioxygenase, beta subunit